MGRSKEPDGKITRLIRLYDRLHSGEQVQLPKLAKEFGVTLRSIQRDMKALTEHSGLVERVRVDGQWVYQLVSKAQQLAVTFSLAELVVTMLSLGMLGRFEGSGLEDYLGEMVQKVRDRMGRVGSKRATNLERKIFALQPFRRNYLETCECVDDVLTSLVQQRRLRLCYEGLGGGGCKEHIVEPLTMLAYKSGLYLIGRSSRAPEGSRPAVFALERVKSCERLKDQYEYPEDWDPRGFLPPLGGLMPGDDEELELAFAPEVRIYVERIRWPEGTVLGTDELGRFTLKTRAVVNEELRNWIIGFGARARVLAPESLKAQVRDFFEEAAKASQEE